MKDSDCLYIFLHIPKTAGSNLRYYTDKNLKSDEKLFFLSFDLLGLDSANPPFTQIIFALRQIFVYIYIRLKENILKIKKVI